MSDQESRWPPRPPSPFPDEVCARFLADAEATHDGCLVNPTRVDKPFWKYMIGHGRLMAHDGRKKFGALSRSAIETGPFFCFYRVGRTETKLPGGRIVFIGGEHEDWAYPDFFIYNDVVVVRGHSDGREKAIANVDAELAQFPDHPESILLNAKRDAISSLLTVAATVKGATPDEIDIYGYPTDFHTATYNKDDSSGKEYIYIIGGEGYKNSQHRQTTLTHRLDLQDFSIQRVETSGDVPPPVKMRGLSLDPEDLRCSEGGVARKQGDTIEFTGFGIDNYVLNLRDMRWSRASLC